MKSRKAAYVSSGRKASWSIWTSASFLVAILYMGMAFCTAAWERRKQLVLAETVKQTFKKCTPCARVLYFREETRE